MNSNLLQILNWNRERFTHVTTKFLVNHSSRDKKKIISEKCSRTYYCNAKKCILSDPEASTLTAAMLYRRNFALWIKGKHLTCDLMKKHVKTKKNDIQPALKKIKEWLDWEMQNRPCACEDCVELRQVVAASNFPKTERRCANCMCGLECHKNLDTPCHRDGKCCGIKYCSFCFRYKAVCSYSKMMDWLRMQMQLEEFSFVRFVFDSNMMICNTCMSANTKRTKFLKLIDNRDRLNKTLAPQERCRASKRHRVDLPDDALYQDRNWYYARELTFKQARKKIRETIPLLEKSKIEVEQKQHELLANFKSELQKIQSGNWSNKALIQQVVSFVEKKDADKVKVDYNTGFVKILQ